MPPLRIEKRLVRFMRNATLTCCALLMVASTLEGQSFRKGVRLFKKDKLNRSEKIFNAYRNDPTYDLGAHYYLLRIKTKKARSIRDWAKADSSFTALRAQYDFITKEKAAALKKVRAGKRNVENGRLRFQRRAIQYAAKTGKVLMLDTIADYFPEWMPKLKSEWDSTCARIVNRNLPAHDYDIATSIYNNYQHLVYPNHFKYVWAIKDSIWLLFEKKYPSLCNMQQFKADHPWHYYSRDCWHDEVQQMFCHQSLDSAIALHSRQLHTMLELEVIDFILADNSQAVEQLDSASRRRVQDLRLFNRTVNNIWCRPTSDNEDFQSDVRYFISQYSPRLSAFLLLQQAADYYMELDQSGQALQLLEEMQHYFPDSVACENNSGYYTAKREIIDKYIACLSARSETLSERPVHEWDIPGKQEYSAISWDEGHTVYFAVKSERKIQIMRSVRENGRWTAPEPEPALSASGNATPMSMTEDGLQMLLKVGRRLYISKRLNEAAPWSQPIVLPFNSRVMSRATFAPDGSAIIFDAPSEKAGVAGKPKSDLYYSRRLPDGKYDKPQNLGYVINTAGNEMNPYLCADGQTLLFCSDGHEGYGGLDVFVARRTGDSWNSWTEPDNLDCMVNNLTDDYGFTWIPEDGKAALFAKINKCNRQVTIWQSDLPVHARPQLRNHLRGIILDSNNKPIDGGKVDLMINNNRQSIPVSPTGKYHFVIPENTAAIGIYADVPGYYNDRDTTFQIGQLTPGYTLRDTFRLRSLAEIRKNFQLKYATFDENDNKFNNKLVYKELELLNRFATKMRAKLKFIGHTDNTGTVERNQQLSLERATTVMHYMRDTFKIDEKRLTAEGRGASEPKCTNATADGRRCNRRVEVRFDVPDDVLKNISRKNNAATGSSNQPVEIYNKPPKQTPRQTSRVSGKKKELPEADEQKTKPQKRPGWLKWMFLSKKKKQQWLDEKDAEEEFEQY